jgi:hypothetical protein
VPEFILSVDTTYYWRARFYDGDDGVSEWSEPFSFTTMQTDAADLNEDGIPDTQEVIDNTIDLDGNGIPDMDQSDMKCLNTVVGDGQIAIKYGGNVESIEAMASVDPETAIADDVNRPVDLPFGLITFKLKLDKPGGTAKVTVYLPEPAAKGDKWYKYDSINGWHTYPYTSFVGGDRRIVELELKDGDTGNGDADAAENSIIIDPSGIGTPPATVQPPPDDGDGGGDTGGDTGGDGSSSGGGGGGGCFLSTILD